MYVETREGMFLFTGIVVVIQKPKDFQNRNLKPSKLFNFGLTSR